MCGTVSQQSINRFSGSVNSDSDLSADVHIRDLATRSTCLRSVEPNSIRAPFVLRDLRPVGRDRLDERCPRCAFVAGASEAAWPRARRREP
jgi:hypothetical protein